MRSDDKKTKFPLKSTALVVGASALIFALPALGQQGPESLLPPGFGDPPPPSPTPPPSSTATPSAPPSATKGPATPSSSGNVAAEDDKATEGEDEEEDAKDEEDLIVRYDIPPAARRSIKAVGIVSHASGGFPAGSFGTRDGKYLVDIARGTKGPIASRWGTIMARRMLVSRTNTPPGLNGADWAGERAALLLRLGDALGARQLVQAVDSNHYTKRLLQVSMQAFLANGDLSGMCPVVDLGANQLDDPNWKMARPICASLAGDQGQASALMGAARRVSSGIDYHLTDKAVGAGMSGRKSVKIEWNGTQRLTDWRFGVSAAVGLEPPAELVDKTPLNMVGWRASLPMLPVGSRLKAAPRAAAMGILSNRDMVDLYAQALDDPELQDEDQTSFEQLQTAYTGDTGARISAMQSLWDSAKEGADYHAMLVLTARAAAIIPASDGNSGQADRLIASMLTAGFDQQAAAWESVVDKGTLGWALISVATPQQDVAVAYGDLDDFYDNDDSTDGHKSKMLLAALAGLDRLEGDAETEFGQKLEVNVAQETKWTRAINAAATRGEAGTVGLLAIAAMQARDWRGVPPHYLYHMVRALRTVGLDAEARMIAAEAVTFG